MLPRNRTCTIVFAISIFPLTRAQSPTTLPKFSVVSVKPNLDGHMGNIGNVPDGYSGTNYSLRDMILNAYGLRSPVQLEGLPNWAKTVHYDILAKVDDEDLAAFKALGYSKRVSMLQPVLANRFAMRSHWEQRDLSVFALQVSRHTSSFRLHNPSDVTDATQEDAASIPGGTGIGGIMTTRDRRMIGRRVPVSMLMEQLTNEIGTLVLEQTNLAEGLYDFEMQLPPLPQSGADAPPSLNGDSMESELYQLGLKIVPIKSLTRVLVIDSIERPSPN